MLFPVRDCGGGVNKDALPSELAPGQWSDALNVRFRAGFAARRGGVGQVYATPTVTPYFLSSFLTDSTRYMIAAGIARVFAHSGNTESEITRYTDGKTISTITRVGTTATLTTATAHGLSTGNTVTVYECSPSQYNGTFVITVTGATTFTYTMTSDPGASATVTSASGYSYDVTSNFTGAIDDKWTGGAFNGVLVINNPVNGMYYWAGDTTKRLRRMPGWPDGQKCDAIFFLKNYIIALAPTIDGVKKPHLIMWGTAAEPGAVPTSWTAASTNDAGDSPQPAETGGALVDGIAYGDLGFAFDQDACYGVQYVGGNDIFRIFRIPGKYGLLARHCVAHTPKGLVYLSNGDVRIHNGSESQSIIEGRNRDWLSSQITDNAARSFVVANPMFSEVWVCFPVLGASTCGKAAVWNWDDDTWGIFELSSLTCGTSGLVASGLSAGGWDGDAGSWDSDVTSWDEADINANSDKLILGKASAIGIADTAEQDFGSSFTWRLERQGISLGDEDSMKVLSASRWNINSTTGATVSVYHGTSTFADSTPTYASAATYTHGTTNMVNAFSTAGRFLAVKLESSGNFSMSLRSYQLDVAKQGRF